MKILHTADIHLKEKGHIEVLRTIVKTANDRECGIILVCGDLFDKDSSARALEPLLAKALEEFKGDIFILPGNHDAEALAGRKSLSSNSTVFSSGEKVVRRKIDNFELIAVPYRENTDLKDIGPIDCDPQNSILMAHGSYYSTEFFYEDSKDYFPMFEEDLRDRYRYAALGHYHKPVFLKLGGTTVVNPGSPRPTRDTDTGKRQVAVLDTNGWKSELVKLEAPYFEKAAVNVNYSDRTETITNKIRSVLPPSDGLLEKIIFEFRGMLTDQIRVEELKKTTTRLIREKMQLGTSAGNEIKIQVETAGLRLIDNSILSNPFIISLLEEIGKPVSSPEEKEKLRLFAIERINSLF